MIGRQVLDILALEEGVNDGLVRLVVPRGLDDVVQGGGVPHVVGEGPEDMNRLV